MNNATIQKIQRGREQDKENRRKIALQSHQKLMSFKAWLRRKSALEETAAGNAIQDSLLGYIPANVSPAERQATIDSLAAAILKMTGDTTVTAVSITPDN